MNNLEINKAHYEVAYQAIDVDRIVRQVERKHSFLDDATQTDTSWVGIFHGNFRERLRNRRILELGTGDGSLALMMAALGATHVTAVDITLHTEHAIREASSRLGLSNQVTVAIGDFRELDLGREPFDFVVGKAFLHHLTHQEEDEYLARAAAVMKSDGEARFFEPAMNSLLLDQLRWLTPVPGRPSSLNARAFTKWKEDDPHPERDNSSMHYRRSGERYFKEVHIVPLGALERFHRVLPPGPLNRRYRRLAFRLERLVPLSLRMKLARSQTIVLRDPRDRCLQP